MVFYVDTIHGEIGSPPTKKIARQVSPAHVLEPTYDAIKRQLMDAHWPMGMKLEAVRLADDLGVSITPVRDSLNQLFGEHLVDFIPGEGFRVPLINEAQLRDLLGLNRILLMAAAESGFQPMILGTENGGSLPDQTAYFFLQLAGRTKNEVLISFVASINDRLHVARTLEAALFDDLRSELSELSDASKSSRTAHAMLKGLIPRYHDRRMERVADYVRLLSAR